MQMTLMSAPEETDHIIEETNTPKLRQLGRPSLTDKLEKEGKDTSFLLPEGWILVGKVRQEGAHVGKIDLYYYTPPPRIKLRSKPDLQAYLVKHKLNYDPNRFFNKSHIPHLLKEGILKYHDFKTIVSSGADEIFLSQLYSLHTQSKRKASSQNGSNCSSPVQSLLQTETLPLRIKLKKEPHDPELRKMQERNLDDPDTNIQSHGPLQERHGTEQNLFKSENLSETNSIIQGSGDQEIVSSQTGKNLVVNPAYVHNSESIEDNNNSPSQKKERSLDTETVDNMIKCSKADEKLNKKIKMITASEGFGQRLQPSGTQTIIKKRGRPRLAEQKQWNSSVNTETVLKKRGRPLLADKKGRSTRLSHNVHEMEKSTINVKEEVTDEATKSSTTTEKEDIACKGIDQVFPKQIKTEEDSEALTFFLPEDWILVGNVRQDGDQAGHIDQYYYTPPPRTKLRSRPEVQAYLHKHKLTYDPQKFFVKSSTLPLLIKKGILKYYDSRTVVSFGADDTFISQLVSMKRPLKEIKDFPEPGRRKSRKRNSDCTTKSEAESLESDTVNDFIKSSEADETLDKKIKLMTHPNEVHRILTNRSQMSFKKRGRPFKKLRDGSVSGYTSLKKRGRPSLADRKRRSTRLSQNVHEMEKSTINVKEEFTNETTSNSRTTVKEDNTCEGIDQVFPKQSKTEEDNEDASLKLPKDWKVVIVLRRSDGRKVYDSYFYTGRPRKILRSRLQIEAYLKKHKLNYDPGKIFIKWSTISLLIKKGVLKYHDSRTIISSDADETFISNLRQRKRIPIHTKSAAKSDSSELETLSSEKCSSMFNIPAKQKVGRPRKRAPSPPAPSRQQPCTNFEQRVRIQSKPKVFLSVDISCSNAGERPRSSAGWRREKNSDSAPPRSPFNLLQEDLFHDPWQMLIATIFLDSSSGRTAVPVVLEFLKRWPTPQEAYRAKLYDMLDVIEPLRFGRTQVAMIMRFSYEFLTKDWKLPNDLYGIGKYGTDSYKIFCMKNAWKKVESDDPLLMMYLNWRRATEHLRKKFNTRKNSKAVDPDESVFYPV